MRLSARITDAQFTALSALGFAGWDADAAERQALRRRSMSRERMSRMLGTLGLLAPDLYAAIEERHTEPGPPAGSATEPQRGDRHNGPGGNTS